MSSNKKITFDTRFMSEGDVYDIEIVSEDRKIVFKDVTYHSAETIFGPSREDEDFGNLHLSARRRNFATNCLKLKLDFSKMITTLGPTKKGE